MKELTTAQFAKTNLEALAEPVSIRRYTKVVGTYYPAAFDPTFAPPAPAPPDLGLVAEIPVDVPRSPSAAKRVEELEEEVAMLKRELAARPIVHIQVPEAFMAQPAAMAKVAARKPEALPKDVFDALPKQDREFFERKLGRRK